MMKSSPAPESPGARTASVFSALFGIFLGLALLKFGNPAILETMVDRPASPLEWLFNAWPVSLGFVLLGLLIIAGAFVARWPAKCPTWFLALPLAWLGWQFISATQTVDGELTSLTLRHFSATIACFYLGAFALSQVRDLRPFFGGLLLGVILVISTGWQQHFGGLDATRKYFFAYIYPNLTSVPPELIKRMSSDRIFSTLFYPNALAGVLLLLLPVLLVFVWKRSESLTRGARGFAITLLAVGALSCLYWTKSKGGWLLLLGMGLVALWQVNLPRYLKWLSISAVLMAGLAGFGLRYAGYFQTGAHSVVARGDYWQAAIRTAAEHPIVGTGPGTFGIAYRKIKRPESEMARLTHNDYLEQASDSGWVGATLYLAFISSGLLLGWRRAAPQGDKVALAVWLGLLGWSMQGFIEFGLYIPALAWPAFALFGWLAAGGNGFDTAQRSR